MRLAAWDLEQKPTFRTSGCQSWGPRQHTDQARALKRNSECHNTFFLAWAGETHIAVDEVPILLAASRCSRRLLEECSARGRGGGGGVL